MPRYVALLRSVNVAGHGRIAMSDLRGSFDGLGYDDVRTYIQTGNVLFSTSSKSEKAVVGCHRARLAEDFGDSPAVLLRTVPELQRVGRSILTPKPGANPARHHVTFLATAPRRRALATCRRCRPAGTTSWSSTDARCTCIRPTATHETKYSGSFLERRLGLVSTTRNWNTVQKLCELAGR